MTAHAPGSDGLPLPPPELMALVASDDDPEWFDVTGRLGRYSLRRMVETQGRRIEDLDAILDFGCGVGRVLRHFVPVAAYHPTLGERLRGARPRRGPRLFGSDYNPRLVGWAQQHLPATFTVNGLDPPLPHASGAFDLVYALSVFTHLAEPRQLAWLDELSRVLVPGGLLIISTHGVGHLKELDAAGRARYDAGQLVVLGAELEGENACAAFHPEPFIYERMQRAGLSVVRLDLEGALGNPRQDYVVFAKDDAAP